MAGGAGRIQSRLREVGILLRDRALVDGPSAALQSFKCPVIPEGKCREVPSALATSESEVRTRRTPWPACGAVATPLVNRYFYKYIWG